VSTGVVAAAPRAQESHEAAPRVALGVVHGAFGIHGWIRIKPYGDDVTTLLSERTWGLTLRGGFREARVVEAKEHGAAVLAHVAGVDDRDAADDLRGAEVSVSRTQLPAAEPGQYYWADLIGVVVRNVEGVVLGRVGGLIAAPAHDVLRVAREAETEQLIPFTEPIVKSVDLGGRVITVDWQKDY
jgi:16S rRNA processing protein RimM